MPRAESCWEIDRRFRTHTPRTSRAAWQFVPLAIGLLHAAAGHAGAAPDQLSAESAQIIKWARDKYGLEILWKDIQYPVRWHRLELRGGTAVLRPTGRAIDGANPPIEAGAAALPQIQRELARYPRSLVRNSHIKRIVVGSDLTSDGKRFTGVADRTLGFIIQVQKMGVAKFNARGFHHEFFHVVDFAINGQAYNRDAGWALLNGPDFRGYRGEDFGQAAAAPRTDLPGFLTLYSTSSVQEDKAEVFSFLIADPAFLQKRMEKDPVIAKKVKHLKRVLRRFCPEMNEAFFSKLSGPAKVNSASL
jgi:hypothetical protein